MAAATPRQIQWRSLCLTASMLAGLALPAGADPVSATAPRVASSAPGRSATSGPAGESAATARSAPISQPVATTQPATVTTRPAAERFPHRLRPLLADGTVLDRHILKRFDFDERILNNFEEMPMYWTRLRAANLPQYNQAGFDEAVGHLAAPSFRLHATTESVACAYSRNDMPVEPGNRYLVSAWIRTLDLRRSRAYISAVFLARDLSVIKDSEVFSPAIGGESSGQWQRVEMATGESPLPARFLQITVWLAQPDMHPDKAVAGSAHDIRQNQRTITEQDTHVTAWFDDIEVTHLLPVASIRTPNNVPVFGLAEPAVVLGPRDNPAHVGLACRITIHDEDGKVHYQVQTDPRNLGEAPPERIELDGLPSGLYTARLQVFSHNRQITEQQVRFARLPALVRMAGSPIGVCLDEASLRAPEAAMACIRGLQVSGVKIPIWTSRTTEAQIGQGHPGAEDLLKRLLAEGLEPVGVLVAPPAGIAPRLRPNQRNLVDVLCADLQVWQPYLAMSLTHYADVVRLWQIGADGQEDLAGDDRWPVAADLAAQQVVTLIDGAQVGLAWPGLHDPPADLGRIRQTSIWIPDAIRPEHIPDLLAAHRRDDVAMAATIQPLRGDHYSPSVRRTDLARRIVFALAGRANTVFIPQPWQAYEAGPQTILAPTAEYTAVATLSRALATRRYAGRFEWTDGAVFHIFASADDATLVAWNEQALDAGTSGRTISLYLGPQAAAYDLRGRPVVIGGDSQAQTVTLGHEPVVITGADCRLAQLRSQFAITPRQIASGLRRHEHTVTLFNPYGEPISGVIRLRGPEGWEIRPSRLSISLQPGKTMQEKIQVHIPYNEPVGTKTIQADLSIDSRRLHRMTILVTLDLQLPGIDTYAFADSSEREVIIRHVITNRTDEDLSFVGAVLLPDTRRQERLFLHIHPGQTMVKDYVIPRERVRGQTQLRLNLRQINGSRLLNQMVEIF